MSSERISVQTSLQHVDQWACRLWSVEVPFLNFVIQLCKLMCLVLFFAMPFIGNTILAGIRFTTLGTAASMMNGSLKVIQYPSVRRRKKVSETVAIHRLDSQLYLRYVVVAVYYCILMCVHYLLFKINWNFLTLLFPTLFTQLQIQHRTPATPSLLTR